MPASYGSTQTATITLASLAAGGIALSSAIDNTSTLYDGLTIVLKAKLGSPLNAAPQLIVGISGSNDNTNFSDSSEIEAIINNDGVGVNLTRKLFPSTSSQHYVVLRNLPAYFKIFVRNRTGAALSSTGGDHSLTYRGFVI